MQIIVGIGVARLILVGLVGRGAGIRVSVPVVRHGAKGGDDEGYGGKENEEGGADL